jgi:hypothetical protein
VYADQGQVALTEQILPDAADTGVAAFATGGTAAEWRADLAAAIDLTLITAKGPG